MPQDQSSQFVPPHEPPPHEALKPAAQEWFETLRDRLCAAFEAIEQEWEGDGRFGRDNASGQGIAFWI